MTIKLDPIETNYLVGVLTRARNVMGHYDSLTHSVPEPEEREYARAILEDLIYLLIWIEAKIGEVAPNETA